MSRQTAQDAMDQHQAIYGPDGRRVPDALVRLQAMLDQAQARQAPTEIEGRELDPRLHQYQRRAVAHLHTHD